MKIAESKTPPPLFVRCQRGSRSLRKAEVGFTLQTLIVMAVFVLAATGVGIGLLAVNSSSSDDFEEAGQTGVESRCPAPNEVQDPELIGRGVAGTNKTFRDIKSDNIGCNPICATWEYYDPGLAAEGIGGPEGNGGVYSTATKAASPPATGKRKKARTPIRPDNDPSAYYFVANAGSALVYDDSNRAPGNAEVRFGVVYSETTADRPARSDKSERDWKRSSNLSSA